MFGNKRPRHEVTELDTPACWVKILSSGLHGPKRAVF
jgi:hypothetical protein